MASWEAVACENQSANQRVGTCIDDYGQITNVIAVRKGTVIDASILEDDALLEQFLADAAVEDNAANRYYMTGLFDGFAQTNTDAQTQTATNGRIRTTGQGFFGFDLTQWDNGRCAYQNLLKLHQSQDRFDFFLVHSGNKIGGVKRTDSVGKTGLGGVHMMQVFVPNWTMADGGSNGTGYMIQFRVGDSNQLRELYAGREVDFDLASTMAGLIDLDLEIDEQANTVFEITVTTKCGGVNIAEIYPTEIIQQSAWLVTNAATGAAITKTSITLDADNNVIMDLQGGDPDYPAVGEQIKFAMTAPSVLSGLGIMGYEAVAKKVTISGS